MIDNLKLRIQEYINNRKIVILGFGKEGRSTYHFLRDLFPDYQLCIADSNIEIRQEKELKEDPYIEFALGEDYLERIEKRVKEFRSEIIIAVENIGD